MRHFTELLTRLTIVLFFLFSLAATSGVAAQTTAGQLTTLAVELWPDYDRPAVLVLLTAELPAGTALPATVTIPLPGEADVNAVARFDDTGAMLSDVDYTTSAGQLTLTTPANRFRVEYYAPYEVAAVSYTHLDVYKRQGPECGVVSGGRAALGRDDFYPPSDAPEIGVQGDQGDV